MGFPMPFMPGTLTTGQINLLEFAGSAADKGSGTDAIQFVHQQSFDRDAAQCGAVRADSEGVFVWG